MSLTENEIHRTWSHILKYTSNNSDQTIEKQAKNRLFRFDRCNHSYSCHSILSGKFFFNAQLSSYILYFSPDRLGTIFTDFSQTLIIYLHFVSSSSWLTDFYSPILDMRISFIMRFQLLFHAGQTDWYKVHFKCIFF